MKVVPRGLELVTFKRLLRFVVYVDESAVTVPHLDSVGFEDRLSVLADKVHCQPFPWVSTSKRTSLRVSPWFLTDQTAPVMEAPTLIDFT